MSEYVDLGDLVRFNTSFFHPTSGFSVNTDTTPRWLMYRNDADTPTLQGDLTLRTNLTGVYRGSGLITTANGFASGDYVHILASGRVGGIQGFNKIKEFVVSDIFTARLAGGVVHGDTDSVLQLARIVVASKTSNQPAVSFTGNGTGAGLNTTGGATGAGISSNGGGTSGNGLAINGYNAIGLYVGSTNADGVYINGAFHGLKIVGNAINGIDISATNGVGCNIAGGGAFPGAKITGGTNNPGLYILGNGTGHGVQISGGATGSDIYLLKASGNLQNVIWNYNDRTVSSAANITSNSGTIPMSAAGYPQVDVWRMFNASNPVTGLYEAGVAYFNTSYFDVNILSVNSTPVVSTPSGYAVPAIIYGYNPGLDPLRPTVTGRTLDVTTGGAAGIDWGNVQNQNTVVNLSSTTTNLVNTATSVNTVTLTNNIGASGILPGSIHTNAINLLSSGVWLNTIRTLTSASGICDLNKITTTTGRINVNVADWGGLNSTMAVGPNNYPLVDAVAVSGIINANLVSVQSDTDSATGIHDIGLIYAFNGYVNSNITKIDSYTPAAAQLKDFVGDYDNDGYINTNTVRWNYQTVTVNDNNIPLVATNDLYYCNIKYVRNNPSIGSWIDRYSIQWYKNGTPLTSGDITTPTLSVYNSLTGAALISHGQMSYASPVLGQVYYQANSPNVQTSGIPYMVSASGIIGGSTRQWNQIVGLDLL